MKWGTDDYLIIFEERHDRQLSQPGERAGSSGEILEWIWGEFGSLAGGRQIFSFNIKQQARRAKRWR